MLFIKLFLQDLPRGFDGMLTTFCLKLTRLSQSWEKMDLIKNKHISNQS